MSTFRNADIVKKLKENFVTVAGDCKEFQNGQSETRDWFMQVVARSNNPDLKKQLEAHPGGGGLTAQGFYILSADGNFSDWINTHYAPEILNFLDRGLAACRSRALMPVRISAKQIAASYAKTPDPTTSVLRIFTRISPLPAACDELNKAVGRDHMWIYADDVRKLLESCRISKSFPLPEPLLTRLLRFHLDDNVRGEPDHYERSQIKRSAFTARYLGGLQVKHFSFSGSYTLEDQGKKRGQRGSLEGSFDIDASKERILNWKAFGKAEVYGQSTFSPGAPKGKFQLLSAFLSADDETARTIPPHALWGDGEYYKNP